MRYCAIALPALVIQFLYDALGGIFEFTYDISFVTLENGLLLLTALILDPCYESRILEFNPIFGMHLFVCPFLEPM